ncbi:MAG: hypothetical protein C5B58_15645 [Acidobacteria bacterium]|jgi:hypothetical protein|nr:MAG: hypothetical protein C5B58_15645 [Acidobacteriota bacterium]
MLIEGACGLTGFDVPADNWGAESPTVPDPIFAAIERWKKLDAVHSAAIDAYSEAETVISDRHGASLPCGLVKELQEAFAKFGVDHAWTGCTTHKQIAATSRDSRLAKHRPFLHCVLNEQTADYERSVVPAEQAASDACGAASNATCAVFKTVLTTFAGRRRSTFAFSVCHVTDLLLNNGREDDVPRQFIETLYEAARLMAVQSGATA